jgi:hypothetical protein
MLFSNGRTRNFLRLLFPTRHGEKEEEKVLNENKGGNGMSEHGLRSWWATTQVYDAVCGCALARMMQHEVLHLQLLIWRRDILWVSKVQLHHRFQIELFSFSTMTWNIFWAGSAGSVVSCQIYCFRYLFDRDLLLIMVRGSVRDSSAPQQRSWSRRSYG